MPIDISPNASLSVTPGNTARDGNTTRGTTGTGNADRAILDSVDDITGISPGDDGKKERVEEAEADGTSDTDGFDLDNNDDESDETNEEESDKESKPDDTELEENELEKSDNLFQAIKKESPELFKKFPELRDVLTREKQFTEIFSSVDDARVAVNQAGVFKRMETDIIAGKSEDLLKSLASIEGNPAIGFVHNFLPTLLKLDSKLYSDIAQLPIKHMLRAAFKNGKANDNKDLWASAVNLHDFIFGNTALSKDPEYATNKKIEVSPETTRLRKEIQERDDRTLNLFRNDVTEVHNHRIKSEISKSINDLNLNAYSKSKISDDIYKEVDTILYNDPRHQASMDSLWRQAKSSGFTAEWKQRIINASAARVKAVLPIARKKVLDEVNAQDKKVEVKSGPKRIAPTGQATSNNSRTFDSSRVDRKATTDKDILSDDPKRIKYKK